MALSCIFAKSTHLNGYDVLRRHLHARTNDLFRMFGEDLKELHVRRDTRTVLNDRVDSKTLDERANDVLDLHLRLQLSACVEELCERLEMKLVWEDLKRATNRTSSVGGIPE